MHPTLMYGDDDTPPCIEIGVVIFFGHEILVNMVIVEPLMLISYGPLGIMCDIIMHAWLFMIFS